MGLRVRYSMSCNLPPSDRSIRFPPRIHVLLASHAPLGLVIRRGPSKHVATLLWNRRTDEFQLGQWMKGRIYERRSDLSSDGKYFLYFAMNGKWESEARGSWTAISYAPYLKALGLFPKGDCWHGGGLWTGKRTFWLNEGHGHDVLLDTTLVDRDLSYQPTKNFGGECPGVYYLRLLRDGWEFRDTHGEEESTIFDKPCPSGWVLRKIAHAQTGAPPGKGCYWDEHKLVHSHTERSIAFPNWEWAELEGSRLVWATDGKLFAAGLRPEGLIEEKMLFDFSEMTFAPIEAPY